MDDARRTQLQELADQLYKHEGAQSAEARERVARAIDTDDHEGLDDWLTELAVDFENDHPSLAQLIRRTVDALGAAGL